MAARWIEMDAVEVQAVREARREGRCRPIVAERANTAHARATAVACSRQEDTTCGLQQYEFGGFADTSGQSADFTATLTVSGSQKQLLLIGKEGANFIKSIKVYLKSK